MMDNNIYAFYASESNNRIVACINAFFGKLRTIFGKGGTDYERREVCFVGFEYGLGISWKIG